MKLEDVPETHRKMWDEYNSNRDFSDEAALEAYQSETFGRQFDMRRPNDKINGFMEGKQWMDVTIANWKEDIEAKLLFRFELEEEFPKWFLDRVLGR